MNVYDEANSLAKAIRESSQLKRYEAAIKAIEGNSTHEQMVKDFMRSQYEMSRAQMEGREISAEQREAFNALYQTMSNVSQVSEFIQSQLSYAVMMQDLSKIISEATDVDIPFMHKEMDEMMGK